MRRIHNPLRHINAYNFLIQIVIPTIFVQNVTKMYMNTSLKIHRIADTNSRVIMKVHDLLGQPSYMKAWTSSNFNRIPAPTPELSALARLKNCCEHSSAYIFDWIFFIFFSETTVLI